MIFADGTFIDGSTSELSCDGPLREPFAVYCQVSACFLLILFLANVSCMLAYAGIFMRGEILLYVSSDSGCSTERN